MAILADDNAVTCFEDDLAVDCWVDDLGNTLCCDAPPLVPSGGQTIYLNFIAAVAAAIDPYISHVKLLVTGLGTSGSTTFPDLSPDANGNGTVSANAQLSTAAPISGNTSSILLDGTGDKIIWTMDSFSTPSNAAAVWTIEMLWKPSSAGTIFGWGNQWGGAGTFGGFVQNLVDGSIRCYNGLSAGSGGFDFTAPAATWSAGQEYFLCMECDGTKVRLYLGTLGSGTFAMVGSQTGFSASGLTGGTLTGISEGFSLGSYGYAGESGGQWNHIRTTDTVARYASDGGGTIPATPFPTS